MKEILPCTLNLNVATGLALWEQRFTQSNSTSEHINHPTTKEEFVTNLTADEDIAMLAKNSKDISDANYPDLLYTLRKALLASSFSEEKNALISLS